MHNFCDPVFRRCKASASRLAYCGGHEVTSRFYRENVEGLLTGRWQLASQFKQDPSWPSQVVWCETVEGYLATDKPHKRYHSTSASDVASVTFDMRHRRATTSDRTLKQEYA